MKKIELIENLTSEYGYSNEQSEEIAKDLNSLCEPLEEILESWDGSAIYNDFSFDVYSISYFIKAYKMNFIAALITMDWLIKEPEKALVELKRGIL